MRRDSRDETSAHASASWVSRSGSSTPRSEPNDTVPERIFRWVRHEHCFERLDQPANAIDRSREPPRAGEHDPGVIRADMRQLDHDCLEVRDILGDKDAAVLTGCRDQLSICEARECRPSDRRHVVPPGTEDLGDPRAEVLVEEQLHARRVTCWRYSCSSRSAIASFASIRRSISSANSAWYRAAASTIAGATAR